MIYSLLSTSRNVFVLDYSSTTNHARRPMVFRNSHGPYLDVPKVDSWGTRLCTFRFFLRSFLVFTLSHLLESIRDRHHIEALEFQRCFDEWSENADCLEFRECEGSTKRRRANVEDLALKPIHQSLAQPTSDQGQTHLETLTKWHCLFILDQTSLIQ